MSEESQIIEQTVAPHAKALEQALKREAGSSGHRKTGSLIRKMKGKVRKDGEDVWGISSSMKRQGYILHHGVAAQSVERNGRIYHTNGFKGSGFVARALNSVEPKLADDLARVSANLTVQKMKF